MFTVRLCAPESPFCIPSSNPSKVAQDRRITRMHVPDHVAGSPESTRKRRHVCCDSSTAGAIFAAPTLELQCTIAGQSQLLPVA
jgi:hypothetical protein